MMSVSFSRSFFVCLTSACFIAGAHALVHSRSLDDPLPRQETPYTAAAPAPPASRSTYPLEPASLLLLATGLFAASSAWRRTWR